jgi:TRAP-type C4-dicarboxylate transport system substrate-binding protein
MRARALLVAGAVGLAAALTGCAGSGADKAGGRDAAVVKPVGKPVALTLVSVDDRWALEFAAAAKRLSGGTIRIDVQLGGAALLDYERRLVRNVLAGKADLASVGARVWDLLGVNSFRALVAPFLVDTLELEGRALRTVDTQRMLAGVEPLGLVGLAILPGPLRRPLGVSRSIVGPGDYVGATIGNRPGGIARATLEALGAAAQPYRIGSLAGLDGAELDLETTRQNNYDEGARAITANVVLWVRPETIVMSRSAFMRLEPAQRRVLRRAGKEAVGPLLIRLQREEKNALDALCASGSLTFARASESELAGLRTAVEPVYRELQSDPLTKEVLAEIRALRGSAASEALRCRERASNESQLEDTWRITVSRKEMLAAGASTAEAARYSGKATLELHDGRWVFRGARATVSGTNVVDGDIVRMTVKRCTANPCSPGMRTEYRWSVFRDTLTLEALPGRASWPALVVKPARRVR